MSDDLISGLKAMRADVAGKIEHLEQELTLSRRNLAYIDGALHVFGYGNDPAEISSKRYRPAPPLFGRGELQRTIFNMLRRSPDGIDTTELTNRVMRQKGWDTADMQMRAAVAHKVGNLLWKLRKQRRVTAETDGAVNVWRLPR